MYTTTFLFFIFHFLCQHLSAIVSLWRRQLYSRRVSLDGAALHLLQKNRVWKMPSTRCFLKKKGERLESLSYIDLKTKATTMIKITQFSLFIWTWSPSFASKYREDSDSYHRYTRVWISRCFCCQQELFSDFSKTNISKLRSNLSKSQTLVVVMLTQVTIWIHLKVTNCLNIAKTGDPELQRHFWFNSLCRLLTNPSKFLIFAWY